MTRQAATQGSSMNSNANEPAYPFPVTLTKREMFAIHFAAAYRAASPGDESEAIVSWAVYDADALLAELAKDQP